MVKTMSACVTCIGLGKIVTILYLQALANLNLVKTAFAQKRTSMNTGSLKIARNLEIFKKLFLKNCKKK